MTLDLTKPLPCQTCACPPDECRDLDDEDERDDSPYCECGALHSDGTEETDSGACSCCGKPIAALLPEGEQ